MDPEEQPEAIPLQNVTAAILKKVITWCQHHKDDPIVNEDDENKEKRTDDIGSWDAEFLKVDQGTLFELILVSDSRVGGTDGGTSSRCRLLTTWTSRACWT